MSFGRMVAMTARRLLTACVMCAMLACRPPRVPPATVPMSPDPSFDPFEQALQTYVERTQPYREEAAAAAEQLPARQKNGPEAEAAVRRRQQVLADALRSRVRPDARQGELFSPAAASAFSRVVTAAFDSPKRDLLFDELSEQNAEVRDDPASIAVNQAVRAPRIPPLLTEQLPPLPKQLEYDFLERTLILRDVDADVVADYLPNLLPPNPAPPPPPPSSAASPAGARFLPLPSVRGGTIFVLIGDSGSGDDAQRAVAAAMVKYFETARHFRYVLMLGDNLYDDDYTGEFLVPYKELLDRGVTFYAALGNHDRGLEQHFKPFHMQDRDYYTFEQGNARFAVLNSNRPTDSRQLEWLEHVFDGAGTKWRIAFFHHPLYSSGEHAAQSRETIRPALEQALRRAAVNVVFAGHEHLYERIAPQHDIRYFVSGGGGRNLYGVRRSDFDEVAISEHHFMAINIAGDAMYYEAMAPDGRTLDCGVDWRTSASRAKGPDSAGQAWLRACRAATTARQTQP